MDDIACGMQDAELRTVDGRVHGSKNGAMKFSLRDLFWLILVAAIISGWLADHRRQLREAIRKQIDAEADLYNSWNESDSRLDEMIQNLSNENHRLRSQLPTEE